MIFTQFLRDTLKFYRFFCSRLIFIPPALRCFHPKPLPTGAAAHHLGKPTWSGEQGSPSGYPRKKHKQEFPLQKFPKDSALFPSPSPAVTVLSGTAQVFLPPLGAETALRGGQTVSESEPVLNGHNLFAQKLGVLFLPYADASRDSPTTDPTVSSWPYRCKVLGKASASIEPVVSSTVKKAIVSPLRVALDCLAPTIQRISTCLLSYSSSAT